VLLIGNHWTPGPGDAETMLVLTNRIDVPVWKVPQTHPPACGHTEAVPLIRVGEQRRTE
jgi:hypothetical protein